MKPRGARDAAGLWTRPQLKRSGPNRSAGALYRTAETKGSRAQGGIPLVGVDDAIVAAVRLAYKVAEAQVDRSARLANRLRSAGVRAVGPDSDRQALDAAESLVFRGMLSGLSWLEGIASAEDESPIKRILAVEYRMLGSLLGLRSGSEPKSDRASSKSGPEKSATTSATATATAQASAMAASLRIVHAGKTPRVVSVVRADIGAIASLKADLVFYRAYEGKGEFKAGLTVKGRGDAELRVDTDPDLAPGVWRAAICDPTGLQVGSIDIEL